MKSFYHCNTSRYGRRSGRVILLTGAIAAESAVISFIVLFFGVLASGADIPAGIPAVTAVAAVTLGMLICLTAALTADKKTAMHSRYTFLDVQLKFAVISVYSGELRRYGRKTVQRELYLIPFKGFVSAQPSRNGRKIVLYGKMRYYALNSDDLGYHIRGGDAEFDRWWLNYGAFKEIDRAELPPYFGSPKRICAVLTAGKKRFSELPPPKKHVFKEADIVRRRSHPRAYPDTFGNSRRR